ncbi:MAG: three-Cys-motif partner protein TcmP [Myxococcales bacterium]|nr:three-Cys-motif partner protein TcmP [Myxococcales bacterium]
MATECRFGGRRKDNGNCELPDPDDGFADQSVGPWVETKHRQLTDYLAATYAVRRRYLPPAPGGAAFIDLFAGPGRVRVKDQPETGLGSALLAAQHAEAPFTKLIFCDIDEENVTSLRGRTAGDSRVTVLHGDCNERIEEVAALVPSLGLNIALIDGFGAKTLKWATVERLARFQRMDLLIHFPTNTIKRNLANPTAPGFEFVVDELVGSAEWRARVRRPRDVVELIDLLRERLVEIGYQADDVRSIPVENTQGGLLYHLMFASKHSRGIEIWKSLTRHSGPQRGFDFD